ncbi:MAG: YybH family protein, partial [Nitrospiraceae bacterium]
MYRDPRLSMIRVAWSFLIAVFLFLEAPASASDPTGPEEVIRTLVQANVDKDLDTMSRLMAHDADSVNYSIGGRKYEGWADFAREMRREFASVSRLEIPIKELKLWTRDDTAWFAMEIDYIRYVGEGDQERRTVIPLRETGVLERRDGTWVLVQWHESFAGKGVGFSGVNSTSFSSTPAATDSSVSPERPNLSGEWEIEEEDKAYRATLDSLGNGTYSWQGGTIRTTGFGNGKWRGTWHQTGNDREGGFEVLLFESGTEAKGVWWYTRVGDRENIPPRQWGGTYHWKRLSP